MNLVFFLIGAIAGVTFCICYLLNQARKINRKLNEQVLNLQRQMLSEMTEANRLRHVQISTLHDLAAAARGE